MCARGGGRTWDHFTTPQHVITFRMCARGGGRSRDLGSLCMNSTGISVEPMKLQKMLICHVSNIIAACIPDTDRQEHSGGSFSCYRGG